MNVEEILLKIEELTPLSPSIGKLAQVVYNTESTINEVVEVIQFDEAVTVDVLKFANSVMSGSKTEITSIKSAVVRMGGERILKFLIGKGVKHQMNTSLEVYGYSEKDLWIHSVGTAIVADEISAHNKALTDKKLGFTTGLLHDIGKLVLSRALDESLIREIWKQIDFSPDLSDEQAERQVIGVSHADIGYEVLKQWGLPILMAEAVRDHHSMDKNKSTLTDIIRVANIGARMIGAGVGREGLNVQIDDESAVRLGLSRNAIELICAESAMKLQDVLGMYE